MTAVAEGWRRAWAMMESIHEMEAARWRVAVGWKFACCIKGGDEETECCGELYVCGGGWF